MSWKTSLNTALHRATGFMLTRETPEQRQEAIRRVAAERAKRRQGRAAERRAAAAATRVERRAEKRRASAVAAEAARRTRQERTRRRMLASFDEELLAIVDEVRPRTMTGDAKVAALIEATRYVVRNKVPGDVVECGVWRGGSMQAIALTLLALGETDRELHLFDTFEGMPPPTAEDSRTTAAGSVSAEQLLASSDRESSMWAIAGLDDVKAGMSDVDYPPDKVHFHPGLVEDTTPGEAPETISILRLDTDWYASTRHELEHLYGRLSPGGVLIIDDYGDWDGARKATDEWLARSGEPIFLAPMASGRIGIKPLAGG
jgi:hypothetical protein